MHVELLRVTERAEQLIAQAARVSRGRWEGEPSLEEARELIRRLIRRGHESVLEHAVATFYVDGISRSCADQFLRHRLISATVMSQRHTLHSKAGMVVPLSVREASGAWQLYAEALEFARRAYGKLLEYGIPLEDARFVLPMAVETRFVVTANFREWRHILRVRLSPEAQWEIRDLVSRIGRELYTVAPSCFEDLVGGGDEEIRDSHGEGDKETLSS
ncbi:MAG: FAD-dependent thymidylate synthase [Thermofilaceae archaeon]